MGRFALVKNKGEDEYFRDVTQKSLENHAPGDIPNYLAKENVNILIVKGIDGRAIYFFEQLGFQVIRGAFGTVNEILKQFNKQQLQDRECEVKDKFHRY